MQLASDDNEDGMNCRKQIELFFAVEYFRAIIMIVDIIMLRPKSCWNENIKKHFFRRILSGAKNSHLKHVEQKKNPTILSCFFISFYFIFYFRSSLLSELLRMNKKERKKELKRTGGFSILIDARNTNERCCCIILPHSLLLPY